MPFLWIAWGFIKSGFGAALSFCSKPPGSWIAAALAVFLALWWYGNHQFNKGVRYQLAKDAEFIAQLKPKQVAATERVRIVFIEKAAEIKWRTIARIKEVPSHVSKVADASCPIPLGFVRVFNDTTKGPIPPPSAGIDDAASGVSLSTVAETTVKNNGQYDSVANQLKALQDWVRQQEIISNGPKSHRELSDQ